MNKTNKFDKLGAVLDNAVADEPPAVQKSPQEVPQSLSKQMRQKASDQKGVSRVHNRTLPERTTVYMAPATQESMAKIQAFLLTECRAKSPTASAAIAIAIEYAASALPKDSGALSDLYQARIRSDQRKRKASV
jgi:hypothetical protein